MVWGEEEEIKNKLGESNPVSIPVVITVEPLSACLLIWHLVPKNPEGQRHLGNCLPPNSKTVQVPPFWHPHKSGGGGVVG